MNPNTKPKPFRALLKDTFGIDCDEKKKDMQAKIEETNANKAIK